MGRRDNARRPGLSIMKQKHLLHLKAWQDSNLRVAVRYPLGADCRFTDLATRLANNNLNSNPIIFLYLKR